MRWAYGAAERACCGLVLLVSGENEKISRWPGQKAARGEQTIIWGAFNGAAGFDKF